MISVWYDKDMVDSVIVNHFNQLPGGVTRRCCMALNTFTLHIPAGHLAIRVDSKGRSRLVTLCADVTIDDAERIFDDGSEYRYHIGPNVYHVEASPLMSESRVAVYAN